MQTLEVVGHRCVSVCPRAPGADDDDGEHERLRVAAVGFELDEDRPMALSGGNDILLLDNAMTAVEQSISTAPVGRPVALAHVGMLDAIYATTDTEMFVVHRGQPEAEYVGSIDCGILAAAWSPDQELLVVINGDGDLVCLSKDLEPIFEHPVVTSEFGADAPVNVGWGKKETQFQGRAGKLANQPKVPEAQVPYDDGKPRISWRGDGQYFVTSTHEEDRRVLRMWARDGTLSATSEKVGGLESALTWRPSGNLIASTQRLPHRHDVVFFERNGLRHGEFTLPFEQGEVHVEKLAWNCESNILAIWAVALDGGVYTSRPKMSYLQLWTSSNYHWYLQQELRFSLDDNSGRVLTAFDWHPEDPHRLLYATDTHVVELRLRRSTVDAGLWQSHAKHSSVVAVPDGKQLQLTPFRRVVVPPPMGDSSLPLPAPVHAAAFASVSTPHHTAIANGEATALGAGDVVAIITSDHYLSVWARIDHPQKRREIARGDLRRLLPAAPCYRVYRHVVLCDDVVFVTTLALQEGADDRSTAAVDTVHALHLCPAMAAGSNTADASSSPSHTHDIVYAGCCQAPAATVRYTACTPLPTAARTAVLQNEYGELSRVTCAVPTPTGDDTQSPGVVLGPLMEVPQLAAPCTRIVCLTLRKDDAGLNSDGATATATAAAGSDSGNCALAVIGLTSAWQLVVNNHVLVSDCNSFSHNTDFLIFTTHAHVCRFVRLVPALATQPQLVLQEQQQQAQGTTNSNSSGSAGGGNGYNHAVRAVERGSRIVCVPRSDIKVVLQMPRGNLEAVCPRALVLSRAKALLSRRAYEAVFFMLRKHRISLNLLYDHSPSDFEAHVVDFVRSIGSTQHLNLFVMELQDEDVTQTMYRIAYDTRKNGVVPPSKTARVCELVRNACVEVDEDGLLETILTTHIKLQPEGLEKALERVLALHAAPVTDPTARASANEDRARAALKYMLMLVDVDVLYKHALGSYNLEFALMVAQVAQMDPKQYLPFLNALRKEPELLRRYRIDLHLKRYAKALENLAQTGDEHFPACLDLIKEHALYPEGMRIFRSRSTEQLQQVAAAYGAYLQEKREYEQAGIVFETAAQYDRALRAYVHALNWRQVFSITAQREVAPEEVQRVARDVGEALVLAHRFSEAGHVFASYARDAAAAAEAYVKGKHWDAACLLASEHPEEREQLMASVVSPGVLEALEDLAEQFTETAALVTKRTERLAVVRAEKLEQRRLEALGLLHGDDEIDAADGAASDLYSDASTARSKRTGSSRNTRTSRRSRTTTAKSSRGRRKHEGKKFSLKEGGVFEEEALVHSLRKLVEHVDKEQDTVRATLLAGLRMGHDEAVDALQDAYQHCRQTIHTHLPRIWPPASALVHRMPAPAIPPAPAAGMAAATSGMSAQAQALLEQQRAMHAPHMMASQPQQGGAGEAAGQEEDEEEVSLAPKPDFKVARKWRVVTEKQRKTAKD